MAPNVVCLQKWRPTFAEKHMKTFFGEFTSKKIFMTFVGENLQKAHKKILASLEKFGQKSFSTPKILPAPTPMDADGIRLGMCLFMSRFLIWMIFVETEIVSSLLGIFADSHVWGIYCIWFSS